MGFEMVLNPLTKRFIRKGGGLHSKLVRDGVIDEEGKPIKTDEPIEVSIEKVVHQPKFKIIKN